MKHHFYLNPRSGRVLLGLGFRTCAALGLPLLRHELAGQVNWIKPVRLLFVGSESFLLLLFFQVTDISRFSFHPKDNLWFQYIVQNYLNLFPSIFIFLLAPPGLLYIWSEHQVYDTSVDGQCNFGDFSWKCSRVAPPPHRHSSSLGSTRQTSVELPLCLHAKRPPWTAGYCRCAGWSVPHSSPAEVPAMPAEVFIAHCREWKEQSTRQTRLCVGADWLFVSKCNTKRERHHVPLHTKALHLDRLSSEALHLEHSLGQARGGTKAFMFMWDELCELWNELCERTWLKFSERTWKQLHQMPHESSSWVSWVVWDELSEMSCVSWVVRDELCEMSYVSCERRGVVWDKLCALSERTWVKLSERRNNGGGDGGEGAECKPKNKTPHRDVRKKTTQWWVVWWCEEKTATRRIMLQRYNDKITQK